MKSNALVIIGDIGETGAKYLKVDGKIANNKMWENRLKCAWNVFYQTLAKFNAGKVVPTSLKDDKTSSKFKFMVSDETEFITGASGLDVDVKIEESIYKK